MLDPRKPGFAQFPGARLHGLLVLDAIQALACEALRKIARLGLQRFHSCASARLAKEAGLVRVIKSRPCAKKRTASNAAVEPRQPSTQPDGPEREIAHRQVPTAGALHFARRQQDQPEHRLGDFVLRQNMLRDLADHREPGAKTVIALRLMKTLEQFSLLDPHEVASLPLDVPYLGVGEDLKRRAVKVLS